MYRVRHQRARLFNGDNPSAHACSGRWRRLICRGEENSAFLADVDRQIPRRFSGERTGDPYRTCIPSGVWYLEDCPTVETYTINEDAPESFKQVKYYHRTDMLIPGWFSVGYHAIERANILLSDFPNDWAVFTVERVAVDLGLYQSPLRNIEVSCWTRNSSEGSRWDCRVGLWESER